MKDSSHSLAFVASYWEYKEPRIKDSGPLFGLSYEYNRWLRGRSLGLRFQTEFLTGTTTYDGQTISGGIPVQADQTNSILTSEVWLLSKFTENFKPKIGVLYRFLRDEDDPSGGDYERLQTYIALPLGFEYSYMTSKKEKITFAVSRTLYFEGQNKTHLTDVGGDRDLELNQEEGVGTFASVEYAKHYYFVRLEYSHWDIEDSEVKEATLPVPIGTAFFVGTENTTSAIDLHVGFFF